MLKVDLVFSIYLTSWMLLYMLYADFNFHEREVCCCCQCYMVEYVLLIGIYSYIHISNWFIYWAHVIKYYSEMFNERLIALLFCFHAVVIVK